MLGILSIMLTYVLGAHALAHDGAGPFFLLLKVQTVHITILHSKLTPCLSLFVYQFLPIP